MTDSTTKRTPAALTSAVAAGAMLAALIGMCVWSAMDRGVLEAIREMAADRWGLTTLADLVAGLVIMALWVAATERSAKRAALWIVLLFCLGNITTLLRWLAMTPRARSLPDYFRRPTAGS